MGGCTLSHNAPTLSDVLTLGAAAGDYNSGFSDSCPSEYWLPFICLYFLKYSYFYPVLENFTKYIFAKHLKISG